MNQPDQSSVTKRGSRKLKAVAVTTAALIAVGALGFALGQDMRFASAEPAQTAPTAQTPLGAAPLSFADIAQKVTPAASASASRATFRFLRTTSISPDCQTCRRTAPSMISSSSSRSGSGRVSSTARGTRPIRI